MTMSAASVCCGLIWTRDAMRQRLRLGRGKHLNARPDAVRLKRSLGSE